MGESFTHPGLHHQRPSNSRSSSREADDTQNVVINIEMGNSPDQFTSSLNSVDGSRDDGANNTSSHLNSQHTSTNINSTSLPESLSALPHLPSAAAASTTTTTTTTGLTTTTPEHGGNISDASSEDDPAVNRYRFFLNVNYLES